MYNAINPVNISYRNYQVPFKNNGASEGSSSSAQKEDGKEQVQNSLEDGRNRHFPNGREVAIDYSKNKINIAQIVADFNSTVLAINAPPDVLQEVSTYLGLITNESKKEKPSKDIIFSNLKNASKIADKYIADSLEKPSRVVEGWVDALFLQSIELKSDPSRVNPDFKVNLPEKLPAKAQGEVQDEFLKEDVPQNATTQAQILPQDVPPMPQFTPPVQMSQVYQQPNAPQPFAPPQTQENSPIGQRLVNEAAPTIKAVFTPAAATVQNFIEQVQAAPQVAQTEFTAVPQLTTKPQSTLLSQNLENPKERELRQIFTIAKKADDPAVKMEAFSQVISKAEELGNTKMKAAAHLERGKIFDKNDLVDSALREYNQAAKSEDNNINAKAHLKMAAIYDDFARFEPALNHYHNAIVFSGEANNLSGQSRALGGLATMYAQRYDRENTLAFNGLTVDTALGTENPKVIGRAYSTVAKNYDYISENRQSLDSYKKAVQSYGQAGENYEKIAQNYFGAAQIMQKLGNGAKADSLLSKALQYQQRAQLGQNL